jgi:hypothetical protein
MSYVGYWPWPFVISNWDVPSDKKKKDPAPNKSLISSFLPGDPSSSLHSPSYWVRAQQYSYLAPTYIMILLRTPNTSSHGGGIAPHQEVISLDERSQAVLCESYTVRTVRTLNWSWLVRLKRSISDTVKIRNNVIEQEEGNTKEQKGKGASQIGNTRVTSDQLLKLFTRYCLSQ